MIDWWVDNIELGFGIFIPSMVYIGQILLLFFDLQDNRLKTKKEFYIRIIPFHYLPEYIKEFIEGSTITVKNFITKINGLK